MTGAGLDPWLALGMGLLGSFGHCAAMCGPLVAAVALSAGPGTALRPAALLQLEYHAGRITTYGFAGAVMGAAGSAAGVAARVAGFQDAVSVVAGALMAAMGLGAAGSLLAAAPLLAAWLPNIFFVKHLPPSEIDLWNQREGAVRIS